MYKTKTMSFENWGHIMRCTGANRQAAVLMKSCSVNIENIYSWKLTNNIKYIYKTIKFII